MAVSANLVLDGTHTAQVDLSAWQFLPVKIGTTGTVDKADATADIPFGILQNDPAAGEAAIVATSGRSKVYASRLQAVESSPQPPLPTRSARSLRSLATARSVPSRSTFLTP